MEIEIFDLPMLNSLPYTSESSLSRHISQTALHQSLPISFGAGPLWFLDVLSKWLLHPYLWHFSQNMRHLLGSCIIWQYLYFCCGLFSYLCALHFCHHSGLLLVTISNSLLFLVVLRIALSILCTPTVLAQLSTCSIVSSLLFSLQFSYSFSHHIIFIDSSKELLFQPPVSFLIFTVIYLYS